jgi:hypothetical protein
MWNVKVKVIPVILIVAQLEPFLNHSDNIWATHQESTKLRDYKKPPYWALHTYSGKC